MLKLTEQKAREFVTSKGGVVDIILEENGKHYFYITCELGHHFKKEKGKLAFKEKEYCNYYPCSKGIKSEWRDEQGFKIFKERLSEIFGDDVICTEKEPLTSERLSATFNFECGKCKHKWSKAPSYQLTTPLKKKKPPSCSNCGGSSTKTDKEKEEFLKKLNIIPIDGISSIVNMQEKFRYKCNECSSINKKTLNNLDYRYKNKISYCDCTFKRTKWTLEKLISKGESKDYKLQGKPDDINTFDSYKWKCIKGHITSFPISSLENGCNTCYTEKRFTSLDKIENWLNTNAPTIKLLPNQTWRGSNTDYEYKCSICEEEFRKHLQYLLKRPFCKKLSRSNSELIVNFYLEKLLKIKFEGNKKKLKWLTNSNVNKMELDGYNEDDKIAFEHHGIQHYKYTKRFHKNPEDLIKRQVDDKLKVKKCKENKIKLIIIPALFELTLLENLKEVIKSELIRLNIDIPQDFDDINPKISEMIVYHKKKKQKNV